MLVLSRQKDETIMIGDDVEVTVVDIRGDKVRLGITAPTHIPVHRKEVYEAIKRENAAASGVKPEDLKGITGQRAKRPASPQTPPCKAPAKPSGTRSSENHKGKRNSKSNGCDGSQSPSL